jgi:hypothetical protein
MKENERIRHEEKNEYAWICLCNNTDNSHGFYPCDEKGNEVEPTTETWTTGAYVCGRCGRIIDMHSLKVLGQNPNPLNAPSEVNAHAGVV